MGRSGVPAESAHDAPPPTEHSTARYAHVASSPEDVASSHGLPLSHYRGYGRFYERYWSRLFGITVADLEGLETFLREAGEPQSLTGLARSVIRSRLDRGPEINSAPAPVDAQPDDAGKAQLTVRLWDPVAAWHVGDHVIVPATIEGGHSSDRAVPTAGQTGRRPASTTPCVGEVVQVGGNHVLVSVDGLSAPQVYALGGYGGSEPAGEAAPRVDTLAPAGMGTPPFGDASSVVDEVLSRFGDVVVSKLLASLSADRRFVALDGLWFLRALAQQPRERQVTSLARAMFADIGDSWTLDELLALAPGDESSQASSDPVSGSSTSHPARQVPAAPAVRFGWAIGLQEHPDLFERLGTSAPTAMATRRTASNAVCRTSRRLRAREL